MAAARVYTPRPPTLTVAESVFDSKTGLGNWSYWGWAPSKHDKGAPARVDFSSYGGWILARPGLDGDFGGLVFRLRAPLSYGRFLEVILDGEGTKFPHVAVEGRHERPLQDGWSEVFLPMAELNPEGQAFDRIVFRGRQEIPKQAVELDGIGFTKEGGSEVAAADPPARPGRFVVACDVPATPISPLVYGIAWTPGKVPTGLGATARRWGGNPASRYNWEIGHAWNTASDWFFMNVDYAGAGGQAHERFLDESREHGLQSAFTVPILGWVAKDTSSYSFPASTFGQQQAAAPERPDAGNGTSPDGKELPPGPPTRTSVPSSPESIGRLVRSIRERGGDRGRRVSMYILDNEPMLWNSTHRDVHPAPTSYDELLDRTIRYGTAVRENDPEAVIAGPALWGWPAYFYSAVDAQSGFTFAPDRLRHGNVPLLAWWLRRLKEHEAQTGKRLVDVVDVHFYPQGKGVGGPRGTDPATAARRIRSTRGLWDPDYKDESWIDERIMLIPRLRKWIEENNPGLGISIGEWNFGGEQHMSGGLAAAEALGRYGELGLTSAFYWTHPPEGSPAYWAFRAFRNFDGAGGRFLDSSVRTGTPAELASLFASRDAARGRLVAVLLNLDPKRALEAHLDLRTCGEVTAQRSFGYAGAKAGLAALPPDPLEAGGLVHHAPPYSITVLELTTGAAPGSKP